MITIDKEYKYMATSYDDLVRKINEGLRSKTGKYHEMFVALPSIDLEEVNPWTYWQGRNVRRPKILLVGQDWGSIEQSKNLEKIIHDSLNADCHSNEVIMTDSGFDTDINMSELFKILGDYSDIIHHAYEDLFFTNLIPGFRSEGSSTGGFKAKWVTPDVKSDFRELVDILKPQVIICLGKDTYQQAALSYGHKKVLKGKSLNAFLDEQYEPEEIETDSGFIMHMFCVAHPGFYGTFNRNGRIHLEDREKLKKQEDDWGHIRDWMDKNL